MLFCFTYFIFNKLETVSITRSVMIRLLHPLKTITNTYHCETRLYCRPQLLFCVKLSANPHCSTSPVYYYASPLHYATITPAVAVIPTLTPRQFTRQPLRTHTRARNNNYLWVSVVPVELVAEYVLRAVRRLLPLEGDCGLSYVGRGQHLRLARHPLLRLYLNWGAQGTRADARQCLHADRVDHVRRQFRDRRQLVVVDRLELPVRHLLARICRVVHLVALRGRCENKINGVSFSFIDEQGVGRLEKLAVDRSASYFWLKKELVRFYRLVWLPIVWGYVEWRYRIWYPISIAKFIDTFV